MRGLKYLLLSACTAAATWFPSEGEAIVDGRKAIQLSKRFHGEDEVNRALRKRETPVPNTYCRYWGQSSALVDDKLYLSGGIATFKEDFRSDWIYLYYAAIMADLSGSVGFPVAANNSIFSYIQMPADGEATQQGAFWWDGGDYIWKYGGRFADNGTWANTSQAIVKPAEMWRLNLASSAWENKPINPSTLHRAWGGAVASVPDKKAGYFLGGIVENRTDTAFADAPGYLVLGDSFLNFDSGMNSFDNKTAPALGHTALGSMVYIPDMGDDGILVYLGGMEGPSGWVPTGSTEGTNLRDMGTVWIHDIKNGRWYTQNTTGTIPAPRISFCTVVVPSQDKTSWNIFMHGGGTIEETSGDVYGDTWVLTLPSFQWMQVDTKGDKKFEHTCHVVKGNQLLVIGGRDKKQEFIGDPAANYTVDARDWSCARQGIFSSLNLNTFTWEDALPTNPDQWEVNSMILGIIGGNATGGATKVEPLNGWDDAGLETLMFIPTPSKPTPPSSNSKSNNHLGAIIGGAVGGVALIALVAVGIILLRKYNRSTVPPPADGTVPPVSQTPQPPPTDPLLDRQSYVYPGSPAPQYYPQTQGYIWDPQTQQYYVPGSPPPQSPGSAGYYGKPQQPVEAPAEVPATMPPSELPAQG